jgi:hypothetical protein
MAGIWDTPPTAAELGADPWSKPPTPEELGQAKPGFLRGVAERAAGVLLPTKGSIGGAVVSALTGGGSDKYQAEGMFSAPLYQQQAQRPGESAREYAVRDAKAAFEFAKSPEGIAGIMPVAGIGISGGPSATRGKPGLVTGALDRRAEGAAVRSLNADRTAFKKAFKGDPEAKSATGRFLLDEKIPLRSPQAAREAIEGVLAETGPRIGQLSDDATRAGATFDLEAASLKALDARNVAKLSKNTEQRAHFTRIADFLDDQIAQHGNRVSPKVGHDIRMQLDDLAQWDQATPKALTRGWQGTRGAIQGELGDTMSRAGLGEEWAATNAKHSAAATAGKLAKTGVERREGNYSMSPVEKGSALLGAFSAGTGNPLLGLTLPLMTVAAKRYTMPVAAKTLNATSKAIKATRPSTDAFAVALANALRGKVRGGPVPAAAEEEGR